MDPSSFSNTDAIQIKHAIIDWAIDFEKKTISGTVEYILSDSSSDKLVLDTRDLDIQKVWDPNTGNDLKYEFGKKDKALGSALFIILTSTVASESPRVGIQYSTSPNSTALQWLGPQQTAGKTKQFVFSQCQAIHCRSLLPVQDAPCVKFTHHVSVSCPSDLRALISSRPVDRIEQGETTKFVFEQKVPTPAYLVAVVCGELSERRLSERSVIYAEPSVIEKAAWEFEHTEDFLKAAEEFCGPYRWGSYGLVVLPPSFPFGGMENPCLTFVTPTLLVGDRSAVDVVIHEIAHSWTGNLVTNARWEDFWLNEGFTMFVQRHVMGKMRGKEARHFDAIIGWQHLEDNIKTQFPANDPLTALVPCLDGIDPDDAFSTVPYEKGHTFLWYLEELVGGTEKFHPFLRAYLEKFAFKSLVTSEFKAYFEEYFVDQSSKLAEIDWKTWLNKPGMPDYKPNFDQTFVKACSDLSKKWEDSADSDTMEHTKSAFEEFSTGQKVYFLDMIYSFETPLTILKVQTMASAYKMFELKNFEVRMPWLRICLRSRYEEAVQYALDFVEEQGRMKFTRPVYRELYAWEGPVRERAVQHFKAHEGEMMHVAAQGLRKDLGL